MVSVEWRLQNLAVANGLLMLPKNIYENLPYAYLFASLGLFLTNQNWIVLGFSWLLYTAGAIIWVIRSDYRRANKKVNKHGESTFLLHDDFYESLPFGYIGVGAICFSFSEWWLAEAASLALMLFGMSILGIRIHKRKISWIDDWRKHQSKNVGLSEKKTVRNQYSSATCDQCLVRPQCRITGLTDRSNNRVMHWLLDEQSMTEIERLKEEVDQHERSPVSGTKLRVLLIKLKPFVSQCIGLDAHQRKQRLLKEGGNKKAS
jgi:hypothetical protein